MDHEVLVNPEKRIMLAAVSGDAPPARPASSMAIAIISYNTREQLAGCLQSIAFEERSGEVVVVDNGSDDGSIEMVRTNYPWVRLVVSATNAGYGAAANQAFVVSRGRYVLLLNSDTILAPGTLRALTAYLDARPQVGIAGPRLVNADGSLQESCYPFPSPLNELLRWTSLGKVVKHVPSLRKRYLPTTAHDCERKVGWVVGAALAVRREAFEAIEGFDESFFMYSEEVDLCYRMVQAGWEVRFAPVTDVVHLGGASTARYRTRMTAQLFSSMEHFYRRHYSPWRRFTLKLILSYLMVRNFSFDLMRRLGATETARAKIDQQMEAWRQILAQVWREW